MEESKMLTEEHAFSWKKAMILIQRNGRKGMPTDEQASSWKNVMNTIQQNGKKTTVLGHFDVKTRPRASGGFVMDSIQRKGRKEMPTDETAPASNEFNSTERDKEHAHERKNFYLRVSHENNSTKWKKGNAHVGTNF